VQNLSPFDLSPYGPSSDDPALGDDNRERELCRLAAEHGYRVVLIDTADCDSSSVEYVLIDLTMDGFGEFAEPMPALEAPGGLDAIADQLVERIDA